MKMSGRAENIDRLPLIYLYRCYEKILKSGEKTGKVLCATKSSIDVSRKWFASQWEISIM